MMTFGEAIKQAMYGGSKIARQGWNGRGMFVFYMPPMVLSAEQVDERTRSLVPAGPIRVDGYFSLWTAKGTLQPGWLASQADMLADDWIWVP